MACGNILKTNCWAKTLLNSTSGPFLNSINFVAYGIRRTTHGIWNMATFSNPAFGQKTLLDSHLRSFLGPKIFLWHMAYGIWHTAHGNIFKPSFWAKTFAGLTLEIIFWTKNFLWHMAYGIWHTAYGNIFKLSFWAQTFAGLTLEIIFGPKFFCGIWHTATFSSFWPSC